MAGKSIRDIRLKGFSAIATIVAGSSILIGGWLALGQILPPNPRSTLDTPPTAQTEVELPTSSTVSSPAPQSSLAQNATPDARQAQASSTSRQGLLRIGNFSEHPVRVALLLKKPKQSKQAVEAESNYEPPAHWDFAPGEGQTKGLVLSLPNRSLKLKQGDVVVAFAQDGSRRYWGPYVVGETAAPDWSADTAEWQLSLEP